MDNLINIKQIVDHTTKEPIYPKTHAIGVGYTTRDGDCITVLEALDSLDNLFEVLSDFDLTLGYGADLAFPGNKGKELMDALEDLQENCINESDFKAGLSTKLDVLVSGKNIKTINKESLLIDENTPDNKKNFSLSNSDEAYPNLDDINIKYKALALGEEQMLVLKSMGSDFDILELPSIYDPTHPYTTNFLLYDLNSDGKINFTEVSMLYTFMKGNESEEDEDTNENEEETQIGFTNPVYIEGNVKYTYEKKQVIDGNTTRLKLILYKSENDLPWLEVEGKTLDMSAYDIEKNTPNATNFEDGEILAADVTSLYNIIYRIAALNNVLYGQDFEGGNTIFAIYDSSAPRAERIKIGYNFTEYIKNKSSDYILFKCAPSKNVIYCNSFTGKLYRWSTNPDSAMLELNADLRIKVDNLSLLVNLLSNELNNLSFPEVDLSSKLDKLISGTNIKTINNESILIDNPYNELESKNFSLSNSDDIVKHLENYNPVNYKALAQGEEQMLVLRYTNVDDLPEVLANGESEKYDYDEDGLLSFSEILLIYNIMKQINPYPNTTELSNSNSIAQTYYIESGNMRYAYTNEASGVYLWISTYNDTTETWSNYEKLVDEGNEEVATKVIDINNDGDITASDATLLYDILYLISNENLNFKEFIDTYKIFAVYEKRGTLGLTQNSIIIGFDFLHFLEARNNKVPFNANPYVIEILKPSPNVIYCDCNTNNLYRYVYIDSRNGELKLIYSNNTASKILQLQNRIEMLETYVESQGGVIYHDEPGDPVDPGRL